MAARVRTVLLRLCLAALICGALALSASAAPAWAKVSNTQIVAAAKAGVPVCREVDMGGGIIMRFVYIPAGRFRMGSDDVADNERPVHDVTITRAFYMGIHEVTQAQYARLMGKNPSLFEAARNPVEFMPEKDVLAFCEKFARAANVPCRLPTEAEWEYACRAGTVGHFNTGATLSTDQANYCGTRASAYGPKGVYRETTLPVGSFAPNAWGLYDMHGNVWERCSDWYSDTYYATSAAIDPTGPAGGKNRVVRGGSWDIDAAACRSAYRFGNNPGYAAPDLGFRVIIPAPMR